MPAGQSAEGRARRRAAPAPTAPGGPGHVEQMLEPLVQREYRLLTHRQWPRTRRAQIDVVVVGPSGVFVVGWLDGGDVLVADDVMVRGTEDVTGEALALADLADRVEAELVETGLAPGEVRSVLALGGWQGVERQIGPVLVVGERDLLRVVVGRGPRLTPGEVDAVLARALASFPAEPDDGTPAVPVQGTGLSDEEVQGALLEGLLAPPIEQWMAFLEPVQARLVRTSFDGPALVRGAVGTGKTAVGLHRAAYLARNRPGRVLVATFTRTQPPVLSEMLGRLAPDVADRIDVVHVNGVARQVLDEATVPFATGVRPVASAWAAAWARAGAGSVLDTLPVSPEDQGYWHDEVTAVIKGRGLTQFDQYAVLPRLGRLRPLGPDERRAVWDVYVAYQEELVARDVGDWADLVALAGVHVQQTSYAQRYGAVVVDDAQHLSCSALAMLHAMVGDRPDGLMLLGDAQQGLYPGGFTPAEAGIDVTGRTVTLTTAHRTTTEILTFATELVSGEPVVGLDGTVGPPDRPRSVPRHGPKPVYVRCGNDQDRARRLVARVKDVVQQVGTGYGDVGVLCLTMKGMDVAVGALNGAGIPVVLLDDDDRAVPDAVRVGTVRRAAGLEFRQVAMPDVATSWFTEPAEAGGSAQEHHRLRMRELYVAMTRARDGLWVAGV